MLAAALSILWFIMYVGSTIFSEFISWNQLPCVPANETGKGSDVRLTRMLALYLTTVNPMTYTAVNNSSILLLAKKEKERKKKKEEWML